MTKKRKIALKKRKLKKAKRKEKLARLEKQPNEATIKGEERDQ